MKTLSVPLTFITYDLGGGNCLIEALEFPELSFCETAARAERAMIARVESYCRQTALVDLWKREIPEPVELREETITLSSPKRTSWWSGEFTLHLGAVRWKRADGLHCSVIPALGIAVTAGDAGQLEKRLKHEIRSAINRRNIAADFRALIRLNELREIQVIRATVALNLPTALEMALDQEELASLSTGPRKKQVLPEIAELLVSAKLDPAFEMTEIVLRMLEKLQAQKPRSILLVGKSGVGKTAAFRDLVRLRNSLGLGSTQFWETSGSRIVAGMSGFGMWQERCIQIVQEASRSKAVLHLGNLAELCGVGQSAGNATSIASFLRTYLERGDITAVCECSAAEYALLQRQEPHVVAAFDVLEVPEPDWPVAKSILQQSAEQESRRRRVRISSEALDEVVRLHRRYGGYSAIPGRPLRFLKNLMRDCARDPRVETTVGVAEVLSAFTRETGLPPVILNDAIAMNAVDLREWFHQRIIGQDGAVERIVETLARIKARLTRPQRPIASLMFVGPTGVGKTETAKALAEFLFGDKGRMTRFDMSEYSDPLSVRRLVGGIYGSEGLLTAKVREQPFSVLLLDECEKSDPTFFDLLLQVLGEARLTDAAGREADFSNCVIILTSNLGAEGFLRGSVGFGAGGDSVSSAHFSDEARRFFRPELFNRLDEVIPFQVLDEKSVRRLSEREFDLIRRREAFGTYLSTLEVDEEVHTALAAKLKGSPYGARPLKREIERGILIPLARELPAAGIRGSAHVSMEGERTVIRYTVDSRQKREDFPRAQFELLTQLAEVRFEAQALFRSSEMRDLRNEIVRIEIANRLAEKRKWKSPELLSSLGVYPRLTRLAKLVERQMEQLREWEREAVGNFYSGPMGYQVDAERLTKVTEELHRTADLVSTWRVADPDRIILAIQGSSRIWWGEFADLYRAAFPRAKVTYYLLRQRPVEDRPEPVWECVPLNKMEDYAKAGEEQWKRALLLEIDFPGIVLQLQDEQGWHTIKPDNSTSKTVFIDTAGGLLAKYRPPEGLDAQDSAFPAPKVRRFEREKRIVEDYFTGKLAWADESLPEMLAKALERKLAVRRGRLLGRAG